MIELLSAALAALAVALLLPDRTLRRLAPGPARGARRPRWWVWAHGQLTTRAAQDRAEGLVAGVPAVCDLLAVCLEAGQPPRTALRVVAEASPEPTRGVLGAVWNQIDLGVPEPRAWASLGDAPGYHALARDLARGVATGAVLTELLRARGTEARGAAATAARARARTLAVTSVLPLVVCYLPAFLLVGVVPIFGGLLTGLLGG